MIREGLQIAIVGRPNVGKSSLFNALIGASRAIVTDVPGTTRDLVTEVVDLHGLRVTLIDTAGLRAAEDAVEAEGVQRSRGAIGVSDLVMHVVDARTSDDSELAETANCRRVIVRNKSDLADAAARPGEGTVAVSALTGAGLDDLRRTILRALDVDVLRDRPALTNVRHIALVQRAHDAFVRARQAMIDSAGAVSEEFVLADLQEARAVFEEITGRRAAEDLLAHIFARFCIGK
jgi:tRNA modification GTPase